MNDDDDDEKENNGDDDDDDTQLHTHVFEAEHLRTLGLLHFVTCRSDQKRFSIVGAN